MADLIDRAALLEKVAFDGHSVHVSKNDVEQAPAVDAVEVVRCRECKHARQHACSPIFLSATAAHICLGGLSAEASIASAAKGENMTIDYQIKYLDDLAEKNHSLDLSWDMRDAIRAGRDALSALRAQGENEPLTLDGWISVKDRLPETGGLVLVHIMYPEPFGGCDTAIDVRYYGPVMYQPGWALVTHWQPLPTPPKEATHD